MDNLTRFSDYDVFAYISAGLAALLLWDVTFSTHYVINADWTVSEGVVAVAGAYVLGHLLATPSAWLLERQVVHHILRRPSINLMNAQPLGWRVALKKTICPDYYSPLDARLRDKVAALATQQSGRQVSGEQTFWCAFPVAKRNPAAYARMESFLKLYGFCRNIAFVALAGALVNIACMMLTQAKCPCATSMRDRQQLIAVLLVVGLGMFHRYLKFFRLYNVEVFVAYSESDLKS